MYILENFNWMRLKLSYLLLLSLVLFSCTSAAKVIETIIQPNETTHYWYDRFASLKDLLERYSSFVYKDPTIFMIRIPADTTVMLDQLYSFGVGSNVQVVFQGENRATSKLQFTDISNINMNNINLTLSNLSVTGDGRQPRGSFLSVVNGSADFQNLSISLMNGPVTNIPANFITTNKALRVQNVQAVFDGGYTLLNRSDDSLNITIQNSEFNITYTLGFIYCGSGFSLTPESLLIENTVFRMVQTNEIESSEVESFITASKYLNITLQNVSVIMDKNTTLKLFIRGMEPKYFSATDINFEVVSPTALFVNLLNVWKYDETEEGLVSLRNINVVSCPTTVQPKDNYAYSAMIYIFHFSFSPLIIQNITASRLVYELYQLMNVKQMTKNALIDGIRVLNSTIKGTLFKYSLYFENCSVQNASDMYGFRINGLQIKDAEIKYENKFISLLDLGTNCRTNLNTPFTHNLTLSDLSLENIVTTSPIKLPREWDFTFARSEKLNLFVENATIYSNEFNQFTLFKLVGPQPIVRFSSVYLRNNTFGDSVFVYGAADPSDFLVYLEHTDTERGLQLVRNYRYILIEDCSFQQLTMRNSVLFQGNFINFIFKGNAVHLSELSLSSLIDLRYLMQEERPAEFSLAPDFLFETSEQPDWFKMILTGQPTIAMLNNTMKYLKLDRSVLVNALDFDFLYNFKRYYSQILFSGNNLGYLVPTTGTNHNLVNFMNAGNITIMNNQFENVFTIGVLFNVNYREQGLPGTTFATDVGKFIFTNNFFWGKQSSDWNDTNQTAILELNADKIQELRFENNKITSCTIIDRGFVNINVVLSATNNNSISFGNNFFSFNLLVAGNNLRTNFLNIQLDMETIPKAGDYYVIPSIWFIGNSFITNTIDGTSLLTGSLMSVTPSLVQIKAPDCSVYVNGLQFISSQFRTYGYLFSAIATTIVVNNSTILGCDFREEERFTRIDHPVVGAQGIFFFSSPAVMVYSSTLESNAIERGSYFVLDNFWLRAYEKRSNETEYIEAIAFSIEDCKFVRNRVVKGAIISYSGGYFSLSIQMINIILKSGNAEMEYFLWISDPRFLYLSVKNSTFQIQPHELKSISSNLFYFDEYDGGSDLHQPEKWSPIEFIDCKFYLATHPGSPNPPRITFINSKDIESIGFIKFRGCYFYPIYKKVPTTANFQYNLRFEFSGSKALFEDCHFLGLESTSSVFFDIKNSSQVQFKNSYFDAVRSSMSTVITLTDSTLILNDTVVYDSNFTNSFFVYILGTQPLCHVIRSHFITNQLMKGGTFFHIPMQPESTPRTVLMIQNSTFKGNQISSDFAYNSISTCLRLREGRSIIENTKFIGNDGPTTPNSVILNQNEARVEIRNSLFENNTANSSVIESTDNIELKNSTFIRNIANKTAGAIKFTERTTQAELQQVIQGNTFRDNHGRIGNDYVGYPYDMRHNITYLNFSSRLTIFDKPEKRISTPVIGSFFPGVKSGIVFDVTIHDAFGNRLDFIDENDYQRPGGFLTFTRVQRINSLVKDSTLKKGTLTSEYIPGVWTDGVFSFNGTMETLAAPLDWYIVMTVGVTTEKLAFYRSFSLRATSSCGLGWVFDNSTLTCKPCQPGQYSRQDSATATCQNCPANAECNDGYDNVAISQGYWANMSATFINPIRCVNNPSSCKGGVNSSCAIGYNGPVCEDCDYFGFSSGTKYYQSGFYECSSCSTSLAENIFFTLLAGLIVFAVEIVFVTTSVISNQKIASRREKNKDIKVNNTAPYLRILVTYFQFQCIMRIFDINLPGYLNWTLFIGDPLQAFINWSQCLVLMSYPKDPASKLSLPYYTFNLTLALVLFKCVVILIVWGILKRKLGVQRVKREHLVSAFISLFYLLQPSLTSNVLSIISCKTIDGQSYLDYYPSFQCYTTEHLFYILLAGLPMLFLVGLIIPGVILRSIVKKRKENQDIQLYCGFGTFLTDYESNYYYWGIILLELKFALILFSNFIPITHGLDHKIKSLLIILILAFYLFALVKFKPHLRAKLCKMDIYLFNLNMAMIFFIHWKFTLDTENIPKGVDIICTTVIIGVNIIAIGYAFVVSYLSNVFGLKDASARFTNLSIRKTGGTESISFDKPGNITADLGKELLQEFQYQEENSEVYHHKAFSNE